MDSINATFYADDGFDPRQFLEDYFSEENGKIFRDDFLIFPMEKLQKCFAAGDIAGNVVIDISVGSTFHQMFSASEHYKCIIALRSRYTCIMEMKRWLDSRTGAFYWGYAAKLHADIEGNSDQYQEKEENVRSAVQHVVKCNLERDNIMDPMVLPPADCIISAWLLDVICKDQDDYIRYLRKFSGMLKPEGHLILIGKLDTTYYMVGEDKIHSFTYDEDFVRKSLVGEGFVIDSCEVKKRTNVSDRIDYNSMIFIAAHKEKKI